MNACIAPACISPACIVLPAPRPRAVSDTTVTAIAALTGITFSASGAARTPLFHLYQVSFGMPPFMLTLVFAAYALSLLAALLTVGSLSDYIGRRPAVLAALAMNIAAMALFITAHSALDLVAARAVQGFATGIASATLAAAILDLDRKRGPVLNSVSAFAGLTAGSVLSALLVTYAPAPQQLVYVVLLALSAIEAVALGTMLAPGAARPGAWASLVPHVRVPPQARAALAQLTPVTVASWALGGFYFSLMPSLVRAATGVTLPVIGGLVVGALTLSAALGVLSLRAAEPGRIVRASIPALAAGVALTLAGARLQLVPLMLLGTVTAGGGFGAALSGALRTLLPLARNDERAGLLSAFYVEGYLSFSLPAVIAGSAVPVIGLATTTEIYGAVVALLALASLPALLSACHEARS